MRNSTMKWVAPIVLAGVVIAGGFAAIAAAPWSNSGTADVKPYVEARKAEMQQRLARRVESGEITQAEADDIRAKMAEQKAGRVGQRPSAPDVEARKAEMQQRLERRVESGEITQAEADDIRAKMAERKATGRLGFKR